MKSEMKNETKNSLGKVLQTSMAKFLIKRTDDFFEETLPNIDAQCQDIELQCEGYSLFNPGEFLKNFITFLSGLSNIVYKDHKLTIRALKINLNGFKIDQGCISKISQSIKKMNRNLKILMIHTSDLENVSQQDFCLLLKLMLGIGESNNHNFEQFSLQCANWSFKKAQPTLNEIINIFTKQFFQNNIDQKGNRSLGSDVLYQKRIRLELSGWWSNSLEAKNFLGFSLSQQQLKKISQDKREYYQKGQGYDKQKFDDRVGVFHLNIQQMIQNLLQMMDMIETLQIDLRNNNDTLQMKKLKQQIISKVSKKNQQERSIISMRQTVNFANNEEGEKKALRINIAV